LTSTHQLLVKIKKRLWWLWCKTSCVSRLHHHD